LTDDAPTAEERDVLEVVGEIVAAVRATDASKGFPGMVALEAAAATSARHPGGLGDQASMAFVLLTGGDFADAKLDAVDEMLRSDPVDPRVLDALRPSRLLADSPKSRAAATQLATGAIPLADAAAVLREMLDAGGVTDDAQDRLAALHVFAEFAGRPVAATPPLVLDDDTCFFEGWSREVGGRVHVEWTFTRQLSVAAPETGYDHMEQLHLTVAFLAAPDAEPAAPPPIGGVWAGNDLQAWADEVEQLAVIGVPADRSLPVSVDVFHENV
jgi:hypothetical protein